jgi:hypothetical protein
MSQNNKLNLQIIHTDYFLWGYLKNINNNKIKKICIKNYNNRLSANLAEGKNEDISIPQVKEITHLIKSIQDIYFFNYNKKLNLINFWSQVHYKNETTERHDHLDVNDLRSLKATTPQLSAVYYVDAPKNSGDLIFDFWTNRYLEDSWRVPVETNKFCIFPSGIQHRVLKNLNDKPRVCISMNFRLS